MGRRWALLAAVPCVLMMLLGGSCEPSEPSSGAPPLTTTPPPFTTDTTRDDEQVGTGTVEVPTGTPTADTSLLDRQRALLLDGVIGFRGPEPMRVDDRVRVTVRVADENMAASVSNVPGTGSVTVEPAPVGPHVRASLRTHRWRCGPTSERSTSRSMPGTAWQAG